VQPNWTTPFETEHFDEVAPPCGHSVVGRHVQAFGPFAHPAGRALQADGVHVYVVSPGLIVPLSEQNCVALHVSSPHVPPLLLPPLVPAPLLDDEEEDDVPPLEEVDDVDVDEEGVSSELHPRSPKSETAEARARKERAFMRAT